MEISTFADEIVRAARESRSFDSARDDKVGEGGQDRPPFLVLRCGYLCPPLLCPPPADGDDMGAIEGLELGAE